MRNITRIPVVLNALSEVWTLCPDLRFGQLIENIIRSRTPRASIMGIENCLWNWEEEVWLAAIDKLKGELVYVKNAKSD